MRLKVGGGGGGGVLCLVGYLGTKINYRTNNKLAYYYKEDRF